MPQSESVANRQQCVIVRGGTHLRTHGVRLGHHGRVNRLSGGVKIGYGAGEPHGYHTSHSRFVAALAVSYLLTSASDNEVMRSVAPTDVDEVVVRKKGNDDP
jgi:hypothetical protein